MNFPMLVSMIAWLALGSLAVWLWIAFFRGGFWRADQRLANGPVWQGPWPDITAVIPARDEAETIAAAVRSLAEQDYPARVTIIVVDDGSTDGTAVEAHSVLVKDVTIDVVAGEPLPDGWTGKMWAVAQGVARADELAPEGTYLLLTDADIAHASDSLRRLVTKAERDNLDLVSLMVKLRCRSSWERLLIPAFVFFFQKLFPFPWVNDSARREAAAAGGCMLVRRAALSRIGGIASIRNAVIDDCALAAGIKQQGGIWLGLADASHSLRGYDGLQGLWDMVARTAFVQLKNSYLMLFGTVVGMIVLYLFPPTAVLVGAWMSEPPLALAGICAWILMSYLYLPTLRLYDLASWRAFLLPAAALFYTAMTVDSARRTWQGSGARWKGRSYGPAAAKRPGQVGE
jgi:hopene-associated glycosyltransferase HpnB